MLKHKKLVVDITWFLFDWFDATFRGEQMLNILNLIKITLKCKIINNSCAALKEFVKFARPSPPPSQNSFRNSGEREET